MTDQILTGLLILIRISGLVMLLPLLGAPGEGWRVRLMVTLALTALVMPLSSSHSSSLAPPGHSPTAAELMQWVRAAVTAPAAPPGPATPPQFGTPQHSGTGSTRVKANLPQSVSGAAFLPGRGMAAAAASVWHGRRSPDKGPVAGLAATSRAQPAERWIGEFLRGAGRELLLGGGLCLMLSLLAGGLELTGSLAGSQSGAALHHSASQTGEAPPAVTRLIQLTALAAFLLMGGHRLVVAALLDSFQTLPPGASNLAADWGRSLVQLGSAGLELGLRAGLPILLASWATTLALVSLERVSPGLFSVEPVRLAIMPLLVLIVLLLSVMGAGLLLLHHVDRGIDLLMAVVTDE